MFLDDSYRTDSSLELMHDKPTTKFAFGFTMAGAHYWFSRLCACELFLVFLGRLPIAFTLLFIRLLATAIDVQGLPALEAKTALL